MTEHRDADRWMDAAVNLAETRAHLAAIDHASAEMATAVKELVKEMAAIKARDEVNAALVAAAARAGARRLSRLQKIFGVVIAVITTAISVIAVVQSLR